MKRRPQQHNQSWVSAILLAVFPTWSVRLLVNSMGHRIAPGARIGFSLVLTRQLYMDSESSIGHLSLLRVNRVVMRPNSRIGHMNNCYGPLSIWLKSRAAVGNRNTVSRARRGITYSPAMLRLGELSKITAQHKVDCTASVIFGDFSTLAGAGSQVWTHGYIFHGTGAGRYRVDGKVVVGNNVSIGSRAMITGGVTIASGIAVGAGASVARSLTKPGLYVAAALRAISYPQDPALRDDLEKIDGAELVEVVYKKVDDSS